MNKTTHKTYRLTYPQQGIWHEEMLYAEGNFNSIPVFFSIGRELDHDLVKKAINAVVYMHESLRLRFIHDTDTIVQYVSEYNEKNIDIFDFSGERGEIEKKEWLKNKLNRSFNLIDSDLYYFAIIKNREKQDAVFMILHHLIADGYSCGIIIRQIFDFYLLLERGNTIPLSKAPSYIEYISLEEEYLNSPKCNEDKNFWLNECNNPPLSLKQCNNKKIDLTARHIFYSIPADLVLEIHSCSSFTYQLLLSCFFISLYKTTSRDDIVIATIDKGRYGLPNDVMNMAGMFVLTLPFQITIDPHITFNEFFKNIIKKKRTINAHKKYPYRLLADQIEKKYHGAINMEEIVISYEESELFNRTFNPELTIDWTYTGKELVPLFIHMVNEKDGTITCKFVYRLDYFSEHEIKILYDNFLQIIKNAVKDSDKKISEYLL